jgi:ferredoxin
MDQIRAIVRIDEEKCDGCGLCIPSCAEGALQVIDGKARLVDERFCAGLGNCLGECPQDAIEIIEREAVPFDEEAVEEHLHSLDGAGDAAAPCGPACAGSMEREFGKHGPGHGHPRAEAAAEMEAELSHWPIQLHLVSPQARFLREADLLIAADCVPFAYAAFHAAMLKGKSLLIGCPKLDDTASYVAKLTEIFKNNAIRGITLAYMEVPCCYGLVQLVKAALEKSGRAIKVKEIVVGVDGTIKSHGGIRDAI